MNLFVEGKQGKCRGVRVYYIKFPGSFFTTNLDKRTRRTVAPQLCQNERLLMVHLFSACTCRCGLSSPRMNIPGRKFAQAVSNDAGKLFAFFNVKDSLSTIIRCDRNCRLFMPACNVSDEPLVFCSASGGSFQAWQMIKLFSDVGEGWAVGLV